MTKEISNKIMVYNLKDRGSYIGICDHIKDISKTDREITLKEACIVPAGRIEQDNKSFMREFYDSSPKKDNIPLKMSAFESSYILH